MSPGQISGEGHVTPLFRLQGSRSDVKGKTWSLHTMERMTTHGRFKDATIARARDVLPEPELPATPIILALPHGGE